MFLAKLGLAYLVFGCAFVSFYANIVSMPSFLAVSAYLLSEVNRGVFCFLASAMWGHCL